MSDEYRFATGMNGPVSLDVLIGKYEEVEENTRSYFLGLHNMIDNKLIGILNGKISNRFLWINLLAVAPEYRGKNFGSSTMVLFLDYIKYIENASEAYLAVAERNIQGRSFWLKNGFNDFKWIKDYVLFDGSKYDIIIMQKQL
jgi:RimJ/RimL family protein N-acetyltransferase